MRPALLLVDLQEDFLGAPGLQPSAGRIVERAAALLAGCRALAIPVVHVRTTVRRDDDRRMPHWKRAGLWRCVEGTRGHATPAALGWLEGEIVVEKAFFSGFARGGDLEGRLRALGVTSIVVAGVHLHACVRATVLDAYELGFEVVVADDAVGSDDAPHAAITRRYLGDRSIRFVGVDRFLREAAGADGAAAGPAPLPAVCAADGPVDGAGLATIEHASPRRLAAPHLRVPAADAGLVARAVADAARAQPRWAALDSRARGAVLERLADLVDGAAEELAAAIAVDVGKPVAQARGEVARSAALARAAARLAAERTAPCGPGSSSRRRPLGVVAVVTPWNNPLAIPVGKVAPALFYGNAVALKPSPPASAIAVRLYELLREAGCPPGAFVVACGGAQTAAALASDARVDAVTVTGSEAAGHAAWEVCARRHVPFQAELGGNNAAIVWEDCDMGAAAAGIAEGAFGFAGQRCTANRRAVVQARCLDAFVESLAERTASLALGDPLAPDTVVGPLIDAAARERVRGAVERARADAREVLAPHAGRDATKALESEGFYYPPTIVVGAPPDREIVQEETFGPVLVVQEACDFAHALALANGVRQGLVASLFSRSAERREAFLSGARAGVLKLDLPTDGADAEAPFGGWKASGVGPAEHGDCDREFYTRAQAVYGEP